MELESATQGLSFTAGSLYQAIADNGWEVKKVKYDSKTDRFIATGKNAHDEEMDGWGPNEEIALANLLLHVVHRNGMRTGRVSMWTHTFTDQLPQIAEAYSKAPVYDPKAAIAFMELGRDAEVRAKALMGHLEITVTNNPEPYSNSEKMCDDIRKRRRLEVSRAGIEHPLWSNEQALAFRIAFDVLGYCAAGAAWDWEGTNQAFAAYAAIIPVEAQNALFSEIIGQTAYATYYRAYGPQKIALFPDFMDVAQGKENPHGNYRGVHPSQSYAPLPRPSVKPLVSHAGNDALYDSELPQKLAAGLTDPNEGWSSGVAPLDPNAYLDHGDPLQAQEVMRNASLIDTEWAYLNKEDPNDLAQMRLAITNAFKVVLLSQRKDLRWNAIHYQDISDINSDDPTDYWHRLEQRRQNWNVQRYGEDARYKHMPYYKEWKDLEQLEYQKNPQAGWQAAIDEASHKLYQWQSQEQEEVMAQDTDLPEESQMNMYQIENEANKRLKQRIQQYLKEYAPGFDFEARTKAPPTQGPKKGPSAERLLKKPYQGPIDTMFDVPQQEMPDMSRYGAWMGTHLQGIAQISEHVDEILKAALEDVHERNGTGHHFRATVLNLGIPGVGPKVASFAWLLLQPLTSQLATIDTHMMDVLGHNFEEDMSPRDYFKFERELAAGRDAAGYGHVPLGNFQWGMWDLKRTGPGTHQDHSAMKVLNPMPHDQIDWQSKAPLAKGQGWVPPDWWANTQSARDAVAADFDTTISPNVPAASIPWNQGIPPAVYSKTSASALTPWFVHPETGERIVGQPGQTIMQHAQSIGLTLPQVWQMLSEAGKA